jgi:hypothetical protein
MMNEYTPDRWVLVELIVTETGETHTKVFAGWYGGYGGADSWKLSSGVVNTEDRDDYYEFTNHSGSVYKCYKNAQGMGAYMNSVYDGFQRDAKKTGKFTMNILNT